MAWKALVDFLRGVGMEAGAGTAAVGDDIKDGEGETETSLESKTSLVHESAGITGKIQPISGSTMPEGTDSTEEGAETTEE